MRIHTLSTSTELQSHFLPDTIHMRVDHSRLAKGEKSESATFDASDIHFVRVEAGGDYGWHVADRRLLVITLSGRIRVEVGAGTREFGAGSVILVDEASEGNGHRTCVISEEAWESLFVPLRDAAVEALVASER